MKFHPSSLGDSDYHVVLPRKFVTALAEFHAKARDPLVSLRTCDHSRRRPHRLSAYVRDIYADNLSPGRAEAGSSLEQVACDAEKSGVCSSRNVATLRQMRPMSKEDRRQVLSLATELQYRDQARGGWSIDWRARAAFGLAGFVCGIGATLTAGLLL